MGVVRSEPILSLNRASWDGTWALITETGCEARCDGDQHPPASLCVVEAHDLAAPLRRLRTIRAELGFRSCLHTAEKLLNPWADKPLVLGISHRNYAARMCDHFARLGRTARILLGNHGTPDLVLHKETEVLEVLPGGAIRMVTFHPEDLGLVPDTSLYTLGSFAAWATEWVRPGHGRLGPVLDYHLAFFRYVIGASSGAAVPRSVTPVLLHPATPPDVALANGHA